MAYAGVTRKIVQMVLFDIGFHHITVHIGAIDDICELMEIIAVAANRLCVLVRTRRVTKVRLQRVLIVVAARTAMSGPRSRSSSVQCVMIAGRGRRRTDVVRVVCVGGSGGGGGGIVMGRMVVLVVTLGSEVRMAVAGR